MHAHTDTHTHTHTHIYIYIYIYIYIPFITNTIMYEPSFFINRSYTYESRFFIYICIYIHTVYINSDTTCVIIARDSIIPFSCSTDLSAPISEPSSYWVLDTDPGSTYLVRCDRYKKGYDPHNYKLYHIYSLPNNQNLSVLICFWYFALVYDSN